MDAISTQNTLDTQNTKFEYIKQKGLKRLCLVNLLLTIITLGIYSFWAKAKVRKNIWAGVHIDGEPLQYTGTGGELFKGFLIVAFLIFLPVGLFYVGLGVMLSPLHPITLLSPLLLAPLFFFLIGVAVYRATRYRLSRTLWRGVRGTLNGSAVTYSFKNIGYMLLNIITLGFFIPKASLKLTSYIGNTAEFGSEPLRFSASAKPLYAKFIPLWTVGVIILSIYGYLIYLVISALLQSNYSEAEIENIISENLISNFHFMPIVFVLFIVGFILFLIYQTALLRTIIGGFGYQSVRLSAPNIRTWSFFWLLFTNYLIVAFSFSLFIPVAVRRIAAYLVSRIECEGKIDADSIMQNQRALDQSGEGLASAFEVDAF